MNVSWWFSLFWKWTLVVTQQIMQIQDKGRAQIALRKFISYKYFESFRLDQGFRYASTVFMEYSIEYITD